MMSHVGVPTFLHIGTQLSEAGTSEYNWLEYIYTQAIHAFLDSKFLTAKIKAQFQIFLISPSARLASFLEPRLLGKMVMIDLCYSVFLDFTWCRSWNFQTGGKKLEQS